MMSPDWSALGGGARFESTALAATTQTISVGGSGVANTKGSYVELLASTSIDAVMLELFLETQNTLSGLLDLAVGAAASEQVIVSNLLVTGNARKIGDRVLLPLAVPAGSRIAARIQIIAASADAARVMLKLYGKSFLSSAPLGRMTTYGDDTSDSGGVSVDPGASANTKGAYSQIVASTTNEIRMLWVLFGNAGNTAMADARFAFDIAIGAGGSEQILIPDIYVRVEDDIDAPISFVQGPFECHIPSGTRLAARSQCSITDATDRLLDVVLYGAD